MLLLHGLTRDIFIIVTIELGFLLHILGDREKFEARDHTLGGLLTDILE